MTVTKEAAREHLRYVLGRVADVLAERYPEVRAIPPRDRREPGRTEKQKLEDRIAASTQRHFRRTIERIRAKMEAWYPERKAVTAPPTWLDDADIWDDPDWQRELTIYLTQAARGGIAHFDEATLMGMDYTLTNAEAATWAARYAGELIGGIDKTSLDVVRSAVTGFVDTPGMTISDVMRLLPFDEQRAQTVAVTEITRSYAQGQRMAGEALQKEFPDVRVTKMWFTNNDDRVCDICGPLNGMEVGLDEEFAPDISEPPGHVNCRCWMSTGTKINA